MRRCHGLRLFLIMVSAVVSIFKPFCALGEDNQRNEIRLLLSIFPDTLVLGESKFAVVRARIESTAGPLPAHVEIQLHANVGSLDTFNEVSPVEITAHYRPPREFFPQYAVLTAVAKSSQGTVSEKIVVPLQGTGQVTVDSIPNRNITLTIGEKVFGPEQTNAQGKAFIPIRVAPGIATGIAGKKVIDLKLPPPNRIAAIAEEQTLTTGSSKGSRIWIYAITEQGQPLREAAIRAIADAGQVSEVQEIAPGVYQSNYLPPVQDGIERSKVALSLEGDAASHDTIRFAILPRKRSPAPLAVETRSPVSLPPPHEETHYLAVALKAGFVSNFIEVNSPYFLLGIEGDLSAVFSGFFGLADIGYYFSNAQKSETPVSVSSLVHVLPILGSLGYKRKIAERLRLVATCGIGALVAWNRTEIKRAQTLKRGHTMLGLQLSFGLEWKLGPGEVVFDLRYLRAQASFADDLDGRIGGLAALLGYRYDFF